MAKVTAAKRRPRWVRATLETLRDSSLIVAEPTRPTEFEVQAYLWSELRGLGYNARGEVHAIFAGRAKVRFDIAVFKAGRLVGVIEVKDATKNLRSAWVNTRQGRRYTQFGVPVRTVYGMKQATELIEQARAGVLWGHNDAAPAQQVAHADG